MIKFGFMERTTTVTTQDARAIFRQAGYGTSDCRIVALSDKLGNDDRIELRSASGRTLIATAWATSDGHWVVTERDELPIY